jgi:hypothetical protein
MRAALPGKLTTRQRLQHRVVVGADPDLRAVGISASRDGEDVVRVKDAVAAPWDQLSESAGAL